MSVLHDLLDPRRHGKRAELIAVHFRDAVATTSAKFAAHEPPSTLFPLQAITQKKAKTI